MNKWKHLFVLLMLLLFLTGLFAFLYPYLYGSVVNQQIQGSAAEFLSLVETNPYHPVERTPEPTASLSEPQETPTQPYQELLDAMVSYNEAICAEAQVGLSDSDSYKVPSFLLADYGLGSETFGVLTIPVLDFEMPIFLGATKQHLAEGVAHLSQTSLPIGGNNTNAVIAGHRGWRGAAYLRYIEQMKIGDEVIVTNLWGKLTYTVCEIKIIDPDEIEEILIRPNRELLTLLTCHPYASGGRQRYLVICERTN